MSESLRPQTTTSKQLLSDRSYNILKPLATTILPAISALYFALAQIWGLPNAEAVVGSIAAVNVFLGAIVSLSAKSYNNAPVMYDGVISLDDSDTPLVQFHREPSSVPSSQNVAIFKLER